MNLASATSWLFWFDAPFALRLMQALLHFVWQGCVIAGLYALVAYRLRNAAADGRYVAGLSMLGLMMACVPATFLAIGADERTLGVASPPAAADLRAIITPSGIDFSAQADGGTEHEINRPAVGPIAVVDAPSAVAPAHAGTEGGTNWIAGASSYATGVYFFGVAVMLVRLSVGLWGGRRLRLASVACDDERILKVLARLARKIGLKAAPRMCWCARLAEPVVVGVLRPTILLPTALVTGLSTDQLQAILLHELAHVRRYDLAANLLQRLVEVVLFFHPAVWWLSRRVTIERENACDDAVLRLDCPPIRYAEALVRVAELSAASPLRSRGRIARLAATGDRTRDSSQFKRRVLRVLGGEDKGSLRLTPSPIALLLLLIAGAVLAPSAWRQSASAETSVAEAKDAAAEKKDKPAAADAPPAAAAEVATEDERSLEASTPDAKATVAFDRDTVQLGANSMDVWALSFSADDKFLAASGGAGYDTNAGQVQIWDFAKAQEIASYSTPRGDLTVVLSPDGRRVAWTSWSGDIWLREVDGAELLHEKFEAPLRAVFSPDGKLLVAASERSQLRTWNAVTGKQLDKSEGGFRGGTFPFFWVGFSPDGKYLVAGGGKKNDPGGVKVGVWDVKTGRQLYKLSDNTDRVWWASISSDSKTLATNGDRSIVLWDLATGARQSETEQTSRRVFRMQCSPDGSLMAATGGDGADGVVSLWDLSTGKVVGTLNGHEQDVRAMAFTHDGKTLATAGKDRTIRLWDVGSRKQIRMFQGSKNPSDPTAQTAPILATAYSPDGGSVATADEEGQVSVYALSPPRLLRSWTAHTDAAAALAYSPDGRTLVSGGYDKAVKVWNLSTGELVRSLEGHKGWVMSLAISHDGQTLASGSYDRSIRLWNMADGVERKVLDGHTATVRSLAFSHSDKLLASGSADHTVRLWDAASGQELAALAGHQAVVRSIAFSPDDRLLASGGEDQTVKLWNVGSHDLRGTLTGHTDIVSGVAFAQDTLVSVSWDHTIRTWDVGAIEPRGSLPAAPCPVVALAVTADGRKMLTANADQSLALWKSSVVQGQRTGSLGKYRAFPWTAAFSPDGASLAVAAGGFDEESELCLYDVATKAEKYRVTFPDSVRSIAFSPAGNMLAMGFAKKKLLLVDPATGDELATLEAESTDATPTPRVRFTQVAFSANGKLLAATWLDGAVRIYDVEHRKLLKTLTGHKERVLAIAFSPDQKQLISGSQDKTAIVWDLDRGERRFSLPAQPGVLGVGAVGWSPDGKLLATGSGKDICSLWDARTGRLLKSLTAHEGKVFETVFSPDGKLLATGGEDHLTKLWDVETGKVVRSYDCRSGKVLCVRFSPDGKSFVTAGRDGDAKLWWVLPPDAQ
ncbi:MAG TPA: M56 family metallopeptidase [Pirellulales bacterium]|jgi:WD40 repeat protein|nr:M56 family metallopeptidase [Pirellulales bacterium]